MKIEIDDKNGYNIIPGGGQTVAIEKTFKGKAKAHIIISPRVVDDVDAVVAEATATKQGFHQVVQRLGLPVYWGES